MTNELHEDCLTTISMSIKKGLDFPFIAVSSILNGKGLQELIKNNENESKILSFLEKNKHADVAGIIEKFNLSISEVSKALNSLKEKKLIAKA